MKKWVFPLLVLYAVSVKASERNILTFQVDLLNRHYWRGFVFGEAPAIEPQVTFGVKNISFNIWAAQTFDKSYSEIDLVPSWSAGNFSVSFYDYYNPLPGESNRYFNFSGSGNRHSGEAVISYNSSSKLPLYIMVGTFIYGDRHPVNLKHQFSTWIQAAYSFRVSGAAADFSVGITPRESFYSDGFALLHMGFSMSRQWHFSDNTHVPLKFSLNANPAISRIWVIFSFGLKTVKYFDKPNKNQL